MTGSFGTKVFEVSQSSIVTPSDIAISEALNYEEQERAGDKPAIYIKAPGAMNISFSIQVMAPYADVVGEIRFWLLKMRTQQPEVLTLGTTAWGSNKMLLNKVNASEIVVAGDGTYSKAKLDLSFIEYVAEGTDEDGKKAAEGPVEKAARIMLAEGV